MCKPRPRPMPRPRPRPGQARPSEAKVLTGGGAENCDSRKSPPHCLLAIPVFDRIAGLSNRHLNSYANVNDLEVRLRALTDRGKD